MQQRQFLLYSIALILTLQTIGVGFLWLNISWTGILILIIIPWVVFGFGMYILKKIYSVTKKNLPKANITKLPPAAPPKPKFIIKIEPVQAPAPAKSIKPLKEVPRLYDNIIKIDNINDYIKKLLQQKSKYQLHAVFVFTIKDFHNIEQQYGPADLTDLIGQLMLSFNRQFPDAKFFTKISEQEFAFVVENAQNQAELDTTAESLLSTFSIPFIISGKRYRTQVILGIAILNTDGDTSEILIERAQSALRNVLTDPVEQYEYFNPIFNQSRDMRKVLRQDIYHAVRRKEFKLLYQPIYDLQKLEIIGIEALLRWEHAEFGLLKPESFLVIAEQAEQLDKIHQWVMQSALRQLKISQSILDNKNIYLTINLSPNLITANFINNTMLLLKQSHLAPQLLCFEVSEKNVAKQLHLIINLLRECSKAHIQIGIDEFNAKNLPIQLLQNLPVNQIKISQELLNELQNNNTNNFDNIVYLSESLKARLIATGIEDQDIIQKLLQKKCYFGQGYFLAEPLGDAELIKLFEEKVQKS